MKTNRYTHVFWDWNGTIIDDLSTNLSVINTLLVNRKKSSISLSEYRKVFTFPIKDFYSKVGLPTDGKEYEQLVDDYWNLYKKEIQNIPLMAGIKGMLCTLKEHQIKQYILSASDKGMICDQMSIYGIRDYFEEIIAPQDGYAHGKVELAKQWMSKQNISVAKVIMIGDTFHDYETAKALSIDCLLVNKGHQDLTCIEKNAKIRAVNDVCEINTSIFES